ncbi:hypothetical protein Ancab_022075 [Ancistrocladus abbreviatus]
MDSLQVQLVASLLLISGVVWSSSQSTNFYDNYQITWGYDHVSVLNQESEVQLSFDKYSGSGFGSKLTYGSGFFDMKMKLPNNAYTGGLVITFFLSSSGNSHDELDFEFLGHTVGQPYTLQTNVFANGQGNREQRINLWFDPAADFHYYRILWNRRQVVFYVDDTPIRVFKNNEKIGVPYLTQPMQILTSIWNGDSWATDGGRAKMNYSSAPFYAQFQGFAISGCPLQSSSNIQSCHSSQYWWNAQKYWQLDSAQQSAYDNVKKNYMNYDYCTDRNRYPTPPPECSTE